MNMHNPPHPGEFIKETYLEPLNISVRQAAEKLGVAPSTLNRLIRGEAHISPIMALRLNKAFGRSAESWLNMQANFDLYHAKSLVNLEKVSIIYQQEHVS